MRRLLLAIGTCVLASATWVGTASASLYKVDVRGSSKVTWSFDGELEVGGCGTSGGNIPLTRHFTGSGTSQFEFRSKTPGQGLIMRDLRGKLFASYSADAVASGKLDGSWMASETHGGCPEFAPSPAFTEETGACGAQSWHMSLIGQSDNGYLWSAGKENLAKPGSPESSRYDECPFALSSGMPMVSRVGGTAGPGLTPCEQNSGLIGHKLTWELTSLGRGIANVKVPVKAKSAGKKTVVLSRTVTKTCLIPIDNGAAGSKPTMRVTVDTRLTLTFRRTVK
jgi:hypothetical protein